MRRQLQGSAERERPDRGMKVLVEVPNVTTARLGGCSPDSKRSAGDPQLGVKRWDRSARIEDGVPAQANAFAVALRS